MIPLKIAIVNPPAKKFKNYPRKIVRKPHVSQGKPQWLPDCYPITQKTANRNVGNPKGVNGDKFPFFSDCFYHKGHTKVGYATSLCAFVPS